METCEKVFISALVTFIISLATMFYKAAEAEVNQVSFMGVDNVLVEKVMIKENAFVNTLNMTIMLPYAGNQSCPDLYLVGERKSEGTELNVLTLCKGVVKETTKYDGYKFLYNGMMLYIFKERENA